ncbi:hypothetical protein BH24CHL6_BH24CHL6_09090 [soil metagenome]
MSEIDPCREARRLVALHRAGEQRLRDTRRRLNELTADLQSNLPVTDRALLAAAKAQAQRDYRQAYRQTSDPAALRQAASTWLDAVSRLNRAAYRAARHGPSTVAQLSELEETVGRLELELDGSRIRAEAARDRCNESRQAAAAAEDSQPGSVKPPPGPASGGAAHVPAITMLLRGNRLVLQQVAARVADESELDASRAQLLIVELCEQIAASALLNSAISFPAEHEFWGQFEPAEARSVSATLGQLGYRFDGRDGWLDERVPPPRQLTYALAHAGLDNRVRRPLTQAQLNTLWRGSKLEPVQHVVQRAPDFSLEQVHRLLGARAASLDELWDNWGPVRRTLLS